MRYVKKQDPEYPAQLRPYERMPEMLYVCGDFPDPSRPCVAIVGARNCSHYAWQEAFRFGQILSEAGVQIISGMARGCDAAGHAGALAGGGHTFAVLGCGVDVCYPPSNRDLYHRIPEEGGGILSEYEPGTPALGWHFPIRNRIISAFADIVLVAEARKKSGSLITVEYALEQGKTVYAIPGRNRDPFSAGSNQLIAQGAGAATSPEVLLEELQSIRIRQKPVPERLKKTEQMRRELREESTLSGGDSGQEVKKLLEGLREICSDPEFLEIAETLDFDEKNVYQLSEACGCTLAKAGSYLMKLCAAGYAKEVLPGYFARV
ncbi:MAG: DNA-processing protein DprA [Eubacterium sp.]|nr:DNA-processing protein DprA [Eubacterium sp.]